MIQIDMPMPEKCGLCPCFHHENPMYCQAAKADKNKKIVSPYGSPRPEWCPMKEQEAVEPQIAPFPDASRSDGSWYYICGACSKPIDPNDKYCRECGRPILWEGR